MTLSTLSITELRSYAAKLGITVEGNKRFKATWISAIEAYESAVVRIEDAIEDVRPALEVALVATFVTTEIVVDHAIAAYEFYTSPKALEVYKAVAVTVLTLAIVFGIYSKKAWDFAGLACRAAWNIPTARKARRAVKERLNSWTRKLSQRIEIEWTALMFLAMVEQFQVESLEISNEI